LRSWTCEILRVSFGRDDGRIERPARRRIIPNQSLIESVTKVWLAGLKGQRLLLLELKPPEAAEG
jgi:hypothetical protein